MIRAWRSSRRLSLTSLRLLRWARSVSRALSPSASDRRFCDSPGDRSQGLDSVEVRNEVRDATRAISRAVSATTFRRRRESWRHDRKVERVPLACTTVPIFRCGRVRWRRRTSSSSSSASPTRCRSSLVVRSSTAFLFVAFDRPPPPPPPVCFCLSFSFSGLGQVTSSVDPLLSSMVKSQNFS